MHKKLLKNLFFFPYFKVFIKNCQVFINFLLKKLTILTNSQELEKLIRHLLKKKIPHDTIDLLIF